MKCKLCDNKAQKDSQLCAECNNSRMLNASLDRIWNRTGLTLSNAKRYSEKNWIRDRLAEREEDK